MELNFNNGTAFFRIDSPDLVNKGMSVTKIVSEDVVSLTITEELSKLTMGTLSLRDNSGMYSRIFRNGMRFKASFGYKAWNENLVSIGLNAKNFRGSRQVLDCVVQTPSGIGDEGGQCLYNVTFLGLEILKRAKHRVFESGTRKDVVASAMRDIEINDFVIDFLTGSQRVTVRDYVCQRETSVNFLYRLASEWGAMFMVAPTKAGTKIGLFVDAKKVSSPQVKQYISRAYAIDDEKELYYNSGQISNVKSFDWQQHIGESGQGDGVRITYIEGKPVFERYVADNSGHVTTWRLNMEKLRRETSNGKNLKTDMEILNARNFDEVKKYFDPQDTPLAPQGMGYTVNVKMHGDPFMTLMLKVLFKNGFPAPLTQSMAENAYTKFYVKRVAHAFNKTEYSTDAEIVDSYNLTGSYTTPESATELIKP